MTVLSNPTGFTKPRQRSVLDKGMELVWIGHAAFASESAMVRVIREFSPDVTALRKKELA